MIAWSATASEGFQVQALAYFLFVGVPCLLSYWPGPSALSWILAPYHWFTADVVPKVIGSSHGILPTYSAEEFSSAYAASNSFMTDWLPWFIRQSTEVRRFLLASDGYLLIFGALAEVLFVYYLWKLIELALLSIAVPLMRASDYLKTRIDKDRFPIAGILLGLISKSVDFAITTFQRFASAPGHK